MNLSWVGTGRLLFSLEWKKAGLWLKRGVNNYQRDPDSEEDEKLLG